MAEPLKFTIEIGGDGILKVKQFGKAVQQVEASAPKSMKRVEDASEKLSKSFGSLSGMVKTFVTVWVMGKLKNALTGLARDFLGTGKFTEGLRLQLDVLTKSASKSAEMFKFVQEYASQVPFQLQEISDAAVKLYGILEDVGEVKKWMPAIGDLASIAQNLDISYEDTTGQIMRMFSAGAGAADLFREKGITAMLGFKAGVSYSVEETKQILWNALTDAEGKFAGAAEKMKGTWVGTISMIQDFWFKFKSWLMDAGIYEKMKEGLAGIRDWLNENEKVFQDFAVEAGKALSSIFDVAFESGESLGENLVGIIEDFTKFLQEHQDDIQTWAQSMGEIVQYTKDWWQGLKLAMEYFNKINNLGIMRFINPAAEGFRTGKGLWEKHKPEYDFKPSDFWGSGKSAFVGPPKPEIDDLETGLGDATDAANKFTETVEKLEKSLKLQTIDEAKNKLAALEHILEKAGDSGLYTAESLDKIKQDIANTKDVIEGFTKDRIEQINKVVLAEIEAAEKMKTLEEELAHERIRRHHERMMMESSAAEELAQIQEQMALLGLEGEAKAMAELQLMRQQELDDAISSIEERYGYETDLKDKLIQATVELHQEKWQIEDQALNESKAAWQDWADSILGFFGSLGGSLAGTYAQIKGGFSDVFESFKKKTQAPPSLDFVGPMPETGGFGEGLMGALPQIGQMAGLFMKIPQMVKEMWNSIKSFAKGLASLFGWMSEEEKVQKDMLRDLGATISDELAKKIADASKEIGDRFTAVTLNLGDIMRETDITADNFDTFASRARDVFSLLETGMIDSAQATETLNDVFSQLAEKSDELGITFNKNMIEMIQLSRQFGLEVESIKKYVDEKLNTAIGGLTMATQNLGDVTQAEFDRMARAASATFNALLQSGTDVASAIDQMKTVIQNLAKAQEENALKGSAAFNQLKRYSNLVETNQAVIESVKGMEQVYTSLAQVGAMNQKLFNDWQVESISNYDKLIEGGFKQNEALAMMAPTLQSLKEAHETMGYTLDDNTQALIEQAEAAGLLKPDPMEEMISVTKELTETMRELIDHISGHSPPCGSLIEAFDTAGERAKGFQTEISSAFCIAPVENLIGAIGEIPREIGIRVGYEYENYQGPGGGGGDNGGGGGGPGGRLYHAQHGGIFTSPTHLLVGENPKTIPEVILNRFQLENLLNQISRPARDLGGGSEKPAVINIHIAGEKVEKVLLPLFKQASRDGKMRLDSRAIEQ